MDVKGTSLKKPARGVELAYGVMDAMEDYNIKI